MIVSYIISFILSVYIYFFLSFINTSIYLTINDNNRYIINLIYLYLGYTSLIVAAWYGRIDVVKILLENGADANAKTNNYFGQFYYYTMFLEYYLRGSLQEIH